MENDPLNRDSNLPGVGSINVVNDGGESIAGEDIYIPEFYWQNRVVLLPVSPQKQLVYWEITEEFLKEKIQRVDDRFKLQVFLNAKLIDTLEVAGRNTKVYISYNHPFADLEVALSSFDDTVLFKSNKVVLGSDRLHMPSKEVWMTQEKGELLTKRYSGTLSHENVLSSGEPHFGIDSSLSKNWQERKAIMEDIFKKNILAQGASSSAFGGKNNE